MPLSAPVAESLLRPASLDIPLQEPPESASREYDAPPFTGGRGWDFPFPSHYGTPPPAEPSLSAPYADLAGPAAPPAQFPSAPQPESGGTAQFAATPQPGPAAPAPILSASQPGSPPPSPFPAGPEPVADEPAADPGGSPAPGPASAEPGRRAGSQSAGSSGTAGRAAPAEPPADPQRAWLREYLDALRVRAANASSWLETSVHYARLINRDGVVPVTARFSRDDIEFLGQAREEVLGFAELGLRLVELHAPLDAGGISTDPSSPILRCRSCMWRWPCPTFRMLTEALGRLPDSGAPRTR